MAAQRVGRLADRPVDVDESAVIIRWPRPGPAAMIAYLCAWGVFTGVLFIGTLRLNVALMVVFASLTLLFFMLAYGDYTGNADFKRITGYEGVFCGLSAVYAGFALVLNEVYGRVVLPLGAVKK